MKKSHIVISALLLSLAFSAIMTEFSMQTSTRAAIQEMQPIDFSGDVLEERHIEFQPADQNNSDDAPSLEELKATVSEIQSVSSVYQYPGYWVYWLHGFLGVFLTTLAVALLQSYWIVKSMATETNKPQR